MMVIAIPVGWLRSNLNPNSTLHSLQVPVTSQFKLAPSSQLRLIVPQLRQVPDRVRRAIARVVLVGVRPQWAKVVAVNWVRDWFRFLNCPLLRPN